MAILAMAELADATRELYDDRISDKLGISEENMPPGLIWHVAAIDNEGVTIVEVWESEQALRSFVESVADVMKETGVPPFEPRVLPVHNAIQGSGTEPNVLMIVEMSGMGPDAYDRMTAGMDAHAGDGSGHPATSHTAAVTADGLLIVDVWDSPESFRKFAQDQVGPAAPADLGPIEPLFLPVYKRLAGKSSVRA
jgi:heme-degrading monooxygenase HmoA